MLYVITPDLNSQIFTTGIIQGWTPDITGPISVLGRIWQAYLARYGVLYAVFQGDAY